MNYQGNAYVPLRFLVEKLGGLISFDQNNRKVWIQAEELKEHKSELSSMSKKNDFTLSLYSAKNAYKYGENLDIWGSLQYTGAESKSIHHSLPMLAFYIKDQYGNICDDSVGTVLLEDTVDTNTVYSRSLPVKFPSGLNQIKHQIFDLAQMEEKLGQYWNLERGSYTIGLKTTLISENNRYDDFQTELSIIIE